MKKILSTTITSLLILVFSTSVFAVGSGSGGVPSDDNTPAPKQEPAPTPKQEPAPKQTAPTKSAPISTPKPEKVCNDIENIKERIGCRLEKSEEELKKEPYMPEECRAIADDSGKQNCIDRYLSLKPCWSATQGKDRIACVKAKLGLPQKLQTAKKLCENKEANCIEDYRQKIYHLITFRFYDAEERVEKWYEEGKLNLEVTTDFVAFIATSKIIFNSARSKNERLEVIKEVISRWNQTVEFVKSAKSK
ncbi:hypothetical protein HY604_01495 [Candidatus Peregrinibacteria bacterium]|nr:hypothetical protein [Candidatus Peregrinibacteria bacterium]